MGPLSIAYVATAAICLLVALQQLMVALRVPQRRLHLLFALAALGVAGDALVTRASQSTESVEAYLNLMPFGALSIGTTIVALSWSVVLRTGSTRWWLAVVVSILALFTVAIDFTVGIAYSGPVELVTMTLPWGETISVVAGQTNPLRLIADLVFVGFLLILLDATVGQIRRGEWRSAVVTGGGLALYGISLFMIIPVDMGIVALPSLHTFAFLLIVAAMSWALSDDLIRASRLSREVLANERRWQQLLKSIQLLVVEIDREGRIAFMNPFAEKVSGHPAHEMVGRDYLEFVDEQERDDVRSAVDRGLGGDPESENERILITRDGEERVIRWRSVVLRDVDGEMGGLLSVGADVTERREAEKALESAVSQIEDLKRRLEEENVYLRDEIRSEHGFEGIVGDSNALLYVLHKVRQVAPSDATVLIHGETGVGKELIARSIHQESHRADRAFIKVNCAALPPSLIESELFGHERGSFTGADRRRIGRFELADEGTLFLDEVGELPIEVQPKLLRALQDGELERVGGSETHTVDVRVIAATNRDLRAEMEAGRFREDLFYRLEVYPITVPPLRDRQEDIRALVEHFVRSIGRRHGVPITEIPSTVLRLLEQYSWPGNVRELQNVIERAILLSDKGVLRLADPLEERNTETVSTPVRATDGRFRSLDEVEREHIAEVLASANGQISGSGGAAKILGLHANTLRYRMKKLGIPTRGGKR